MRAIIMAGGEGRRLASMTADVPKPMIKVLGKPILEHQIEVLRTQGYTDITIIIGYLGHVIKEYFEDGKKVSPVTGIPYGVHITYIEETVPLGTAGALYLLKEEIQEDVLLLNGDIMFDVDLARFYSFHKSRGGIATLFTHPNNHPYDSGIIVAGADGKIKNWLHKEEPRTWYQNRVNAGLHYLSPEIFTYFHKLQKLDLDRDVLKPLISTGRLYAYDSPEYVKDMGTLDRLHAVERELQIGRVQARNLSHRQKAIFIDRDGTLNRYVGFLRDIEDFELLEGVCEAVRNINDSEYLAIVITNQPVIARGELEVTELEEIHCKMETLLGNERAFLDAIYYCPHHPDKGYEGERKEYKVVCDCRKPKPGLLLRAAADYHIDLSQSWMIGDDQNDIEAGRAAGCQTAYIGTEPIDDVPCFSSLKACVDTII